MKVNELFEAKKPTQYQDVDDFSENYAEEIGSGFEIWMGNSRKEEMFKAYQSGAQFKSKDFNFTGDKDKFWAKVDKWLAAEKAKGWTEYDREENTDFTEFLLIKKP